MDAKENLKGKRIIVLGKDTKTLTLAELIAGSPKFVTLETFGIDSLKCKENTFNDVHIRKKTFDELTKKAKILDELVKKLEDRREEIENNPNLKFTALAEIGWIEWFIQRKLNNLDEQGNLIK